LPRGTRFILAVYSRPALLWFFVINKRLFSSYVQFFKRIEYRRCRTTELSGVFFKKTSGLPVAASCLKSSLSIFPLRFPFTITMVSFDLIIFFKTPPSFFLMYQVLPHTALASSAFFPFLMPSVYG
jgi:hypothetical protein